MAAAQILRLLAKFLANPLTALRTGIVKYPLVSGPLALLAGAQQGLQRGPLEWLKMGQITGQGMHEGAGAYAHALRMSLNPFDILTRQQAIGIERGARERGYHGDEAHAISDATGDIVKKLGIDYKEALDLVDDNMRRGTKDLKELNENLDDLRHNAKEAGISVETAAKQFNKFVSTNVQTGGSPVAGTAQRFGVDTLSALGSVSKLNDENPDSISNFLENAHQLSTFGGVPYLLRHTSKGIKALPKGLQKNTEYFFANLPEGASDTEVHDFIAMMIEGGVAEQFFPGLNHNQIYEMYRLSKKKGGIAGLFGKASGKRVGRKAEDARRDAGAKAVEEMLGPYGHRYGHYGNAEKYGEHTREAENAQVRALDKAMRQEGVPKAQRERLLRDARKSIGTDSYDKAADRAQQNVKVFIELDPEARKTFRVKRITKDQKLQKKVRGDHTATDTHGGNATR